MNLIDTKTEEFKKAFASNLKQIMRDRQITQKELAEVAGITNTCVSYYMTGRRLPPLESLYRLASALGCSIDVLCGVDSRIGSEIVNDIDIWNEEIAKKNVAGRIIETRTLVKSDKRYEYSGKTIFVGENYNIDDNLKNIDPKNLYAVRLSRYSEVLNAPAGAIVLVERVDRINRAKLWESQIVLMSEEVSINETGDLKHDLQKGYSHISSFFIKLTPITSAAYEVNVNSDNFDGKVEYFSPALNMKIIQDTRFLANHITGIVRKVIIDY